MARFVSTPTRPWSPPSAMFSRALPRRARRAASGYGFVSEGLTFPLQMHQGAGDPMGRGQLHRHPPRSHKSRLCRRLCLWQIPSGDDAECIGVRGKRVRKLPRSEWQVLIPDHHPGFIDWRTYEANQDRIAQNTRPGPHKAGGAVREGSALLQGLAACGHCGRRLHTHIGDAAPRRGIIAPVRSWSRAAASIASASAASRSMRPSRRPSSPPSSRRSSPPLSPPRSGLRPIARPRSGSGVSASSGQATKRAAERRYRAVDPDNRLVGSRPRARMGGAPERARGRQGRAFAPRRGASIGALPG